jgi:hypothetical protein
MMERYLVALLSGLLYSEDSDEVMIINKPRVADSTRVVFILYRTILCIVSATCNRRIFFLEIYTLRYIF